MVKVNQERKQDEARVPWRLMGVNGMGRGEVV